MKTFVMLLAGLLAAQAARAGLPNIYTTNNWNGGQVIPDNNLNGRAYAFDVNLPGLNAVTDVSVTMNIAGGWGGDLYAYLTHSSGFAVLLNRVGRTSGNFYGSAAAGINVTLADVYGADIHNATGNPITGFYAPDGRNTPGDALDTTPRTAMLGSFQGLNPNGTWTLLFADASPVGASTLQNWIVDIRYMAVPEPGTAALLAAGCLAFLARRSTRCVCGCKASG